MGGYFPFPRLYLTSSFWRNCEITEWEEGAESREAAQGSRRRRDERRKAQKNISEGRTTHLIMDLRLTFCPRLHYLAHHSVPVLIDPDDLEVSFECK